MSDKDKCLCALGVGVFAIIISLLAECRAGDIRIGYMHNSNHFGGSDHHYNEDQHGSILEARVGAVSWVGFSHYDNSFDDSSNAYYFGRKLESYGFMDVGYQMGIVSGYDDIDPAPFGLLTFTFNFGQYIRARLVVLPIVAANQYLVEF
jgi:hypothetical protein